MNLADIPTAQNLANRLSEVNQILGEGPTVAIFQITTPKGSYSVTLTEAEWTLGLQQIKNEATQGLAALGVNITG